MNLRPLLFAIALGASLVSAPALARAPTHHRPSVGQAAPNESELVEHGHYVNKFGNTVHSPAHTKDGKPPKGATAKCRDGTYSFSQHRSGTCSGHHGVGEWL